MKKNRQSISYVAAIVLLINSSKTISAPSDEVQWLMNDPVSMFDLGMQRISNAADEVAENTPQIFIGDRLRLISVKFGIADYEYEENKIFVGFYLGEEISPEFNRDSCQSAWEELREKYFLSEGLFVGMSDPEEATRILLSRYFAHANFSRQDTPENLVDTLLPRFYLQLRQGRDDETAKVCEAPFIGGSFQFSAGFAK